MGFFTELFSDEDMYDYECEDCEAYTDRIAHWSNHSGLPIFQCEKCATIEQADNIKEHKALIEDRDTKYQEALKFLNEVKNHV